MTCWSLIDFDVGTVAMEELQDIVEMSVLWQHQQIPDEVKQLMMTDFVVATSEGEDVGLVDFDTVLQHIRRTRRRRMESTHDVLTGRERETQNLINACFYLEDVIINQETDTSGLVDIESLVLDLHRVLMDKLD